MSRQQPQVVVLGGPNGCGKTTSSPHLLAGASILRAMSLADQLQTYLTRLWGEPVAVSDLTRIPGGASR